MQVTTFGVVATLPFSEDQKIWFERMLEKMDRSLLGHKMRRWTSREENNILTQEMTRLGCRKPIFSWYFHAWPCPA